MGKKMNKNHLQKGERMRRRRWKSCPFLKENRGGSRNKSIGSAGLYKSSGKTNLLFAITRSFKFFAVILITFFLAGRNVSVTEIY